MRILRSFSLVAHSSPLVMLIGNFDGMHLGHRQLLTHAAKHGGTLAVMTFEPHPLTVIRPEKSLYRIRSRREKFALLQAQGVDLLYVPIFNKTLAAMPAAAFANLLFERLAVRHLIVGENFRFGQGAQGDCDLLRATAAGYGAVVSAVPLYAVAGEVVSSGRIRRALQAADFPQAAQLLGDKWGISGRVCYGDARGREWGMPTANLHLSFMPPCQGIFAAEVTVDGRQYPAAMSIGINPTVRRDATVRAEAHLLDFTGDLYGKRVVLTPLHKLRDERQFESLDTLKATIADDIQQTCRFFGQ